MSGSEVHPCQTCGACCSAFRVMFYWRGADSKTENAVPQNLAVNLGGDWVCMKGTESKHRPRCVALKGQVGDRVQCEIYSQRPSPCRLFKASFELGYREPRCDEARLRFGLSPLTSKSWSVNRASSESHQPGEEWDLSVEI